MKVTNKSSYFNYDLGDRVEAGIVLSGGEAKSARKGQVKMEGSHVKIGGGEAWIVNLHIYPYAFAAAEGYDAARTKKLLLTKQEITSLQSKMKERGMTLVPVAMYTKGPKVKLELALARGKRIYEKRESIKKKDVQRDIEREMR